MRISLVRPCLMSIIFYMHMARTLTLLIRHMRKSHIHRMVLQENGHDGDLFDRSGRILKRCLQTRFHLKLDHTVSFSNYMFITGDGFNNIFNCQLDTFDRLPQDVIRKLFLGALTQSDGPFCTFYRVNRTLTHRTVTAKRPPP